MARVRLQVSAGFVMGVPCKNHDKQLTHIVRVIFRPGLKLSNIENCQCLADLFFIDLMNSPAVITGILLSLKSR
jgi:hypothetical protein